MHGKHATSLIDATAKQNQAMHATIRKMHGQIAVIKSILQAWKLLQEPVRRIDAAAADLRQRTAEISALARTCLERGDNDVAKSLLRELTALRREAASLFSQLSRSRRCLKSGSTTYIGPTPRCLPSSKS